MVGTAIALTIGTGLGIWGGIKANQEAKAETSAAVTVQEQVNTIDESRWTQARNEAMAKAGDIELSAELGAAASGNKLAADAAAANRAVARQQAAAQEAAGTGTAVAGMSGIKNSGSSAIGRSIAAGNNASDIAQAAADTEAEVRTSLSGIMSERSASLDQAKRIASSYSEGGDAWNAWQAEKTINATRLGLATDAASAATDPWNQGFNILSGGFQGASAGLGVANSAATLFPKAPGGRTSSGASQINLDRLRGRNRADIID